MNNFRRRRHLREIVCKCTLCLEVSDTGKTLRVGVLRRRLKGEKVEGQDKEGSETGWSVWYGNC